MAKPLSPEEERDWRGTMDDPTLPPWSNLNVKRIFSMLDAARERANHWYEVAHQAMTERDAARARIAEGKIAYGKLFTENAALMGQLDEARAELKAVMGRLADADKVMNLRANERDEARASVEHLRGVMYALESRVERMRPVVEAAMRYRDNEYKADSDFYLAVDAYRAGEKP